MKRYGIISYWKPNHIEHEDGNWVKWEDVEKLQSAYNELVKRSFTELKGEVGGCNCEDMVNDAMNNHLRDYWVCPVHGYKKL